MRYAILCVVAVSLSGGCKKDEASPAGAAASGAPSVSGGIAQIVIPDVKYSSAAADTAKGKEMFAEKGCVACHKIGGGKLVGPDLKGV
ncbi:MAG: c-type cytochrome, partial [Myxococcales bacterium]